MSSTRARLDFQLRAAMVWEALAASPTPLTISDWAEAAQLTRSPYLRDIVDQLHERGYVERGLATGRAGHAVIVYWPIAAPDW